ncbi:hypothetical protein Droror1_Dr00020466 [Drosera rotundifolia]
MATGDEGKKLPEGRKYKGGLSFLMENKEALENRRKDMMARCYGGFKIPEAEKYNALLSVGETWCRSVVQPLYFIMSFRGNLLEYFERRKELDLDGNENNDNSILTLARLFSQWWPSVQRVHANEIKQLSMLPGKVEEINRHEKQTVMASSKRFEQIAMTECGFDYSRGYRHQDAHAFLNFLFNEIDKEKDSADVYLGMPLVSLLREFRGTEKTFLSLNLDVTFCASLTDRLRDFTSKEIFYKRPCRGCHSSYIEAETNVIRKAPLEVLVIRLNRFKESEHGGLEKLRGQVFFPHEIMLEKAKEDNQPTYSLSAMIMHVGITTPDFGPYVSLVKWMNSWLYFHDETVDKFDVLDLDSYGSPAGIIIYRKHPFQATHFDWENAYILFYERKD